MRVLKHWVLLFVISFSTTSFADHDQTNTQLTGTYPFGPGNAIAYDATRNVYFVGSGGGVLAMDLSRPATPVVINDSIRTGNVVWGLVFDDATRRLYVGAQDLLIWDVTDIQHPVQLSALAHEGGVTTLFSSTSFLVNRLSLEGNTLFTVGGTRVHAIDVSDPSNPVLKHSFTESAAGSGGLALNLNDVASKGNLVFVTGTQADMRIYDYSPANGFTRLHTTGWSVATSRSPVVHGNFLFYYSSSFASGLAVMDISSPDSFSPTSQPLYPQYQELFAVRGTVGFASNSAAGGAQIDLVDVSNPPSLVPIASLPLPSWVKALDASGDQIAMITYAANMQLADYGTPSAPTLVGSYVLDGASTHVKLNGTQALLTQPYSGVQLINIADPSQPVRQATILPIEYTMNAVAQGGLAYVLDTRLLRIFDVSTASAPVLLGEHTITPVTAPAGALPRSLAVGNSIAMDSVNSEVEIVDISQPGSPQLLSRYVARNYVWSIRIEGSLAYLSTTDGLQLIDISNPAVPREVGFFPLFVTRDVVVQGTLAYVASANYFVVLDVSKPTAIKQLASRSASGTVNAVAVSGDYAYVANSYDGVQVFNVSNPANPTVVGVYVDRNVSGLEAFSNYFVTAGTSVGLKVVENLGGGTSGNQAPVANAGSDQTAKSGSVVTLNGSASSDPDGDAIAFQWRQTSGTSVTLSNATSSTATFTAPRLKRRSKSVVLTFELSVTDSQGATATDSVSVTVTP